jgi:pseudoazurin
LKKFLLAITALFFANTLSAATVEVEMLNRLEKESMVYSKSIVNIQTGDTVKWLATTKGHNVQFLKTPEGVGAFRSKLNVDTEYTFTVPGIYLYQCTPHKNMGMIAVVVVDNNLDNLEEISSSKVAGKSKGRLAKIIDTLNS